MYAIVAQLDRAFGSDPEGQRFESSRSHQEKPEHIRVLVFLFSVRREDLNKAAARSAASKATVRLCLARGSQRVGMSNKRTTVHPGEMELSLFVFHPDAVQSVCDKGLPV